MKTKHTCKECAFYEYNYCKRTNNATRPIMYACDRFRSWEQRKAELEEEKARLEKEMMERLNFLLTGCFISATATSQMIEYFDDQFEDKKAEADWRQSRKKAANEISRCVKRIRDIFQHTFMVDQTAVMTAHGTKPFDVEAYDNHEDDARRWNKLLLHHMETTWQDESKEDMLLKFYESLTHVGIFKDYDFRHFTTK